MNEATQIQQLEDLRQVYHPDCIVCGHGNRSGLGLRFEQREDGSVETRFGCDSSYQGYPDRLHGGVVAMLLDAAMTQCLFARGQTSLTAKLEIQFRHPVAVGKEAVVRAWVESESPSYHVLEGEVIQEGQVKAVGQGMLIPQDGAPAD